MAELILIIFAVAGLVLVRWMNWLTTGATIVACLYGATVVLAGGWDWLVPLLLFFCTASALTKVGATDTTSSPRDTVQVLCNGGAGWLMAIGMLVYPATVWYVAFLGVQAAATADTWATEIGKLSRGVTVDIISWEHVDQGASGGITMLGTVASFLGSFLIAIPVFLFGFSWIVAAAVAVGGFVGSLTDSVLGASLQARFRTPEGNLTEYSDAGVHIKGIWWVDNHIVNLIATSLGALLTVIFWMGG